MEGLEKVTIVNNLKMLIRDYQKRNKRLDGSEPTQEEIAKDAQINVTTLSRYANNQINSVNFEIWQKLSDFFGVPGEQIFRVIPNVPDEPTDKKQRNS
jgi:transcriptional regulator with XRE-family HTH domain